MQAGRQQYLVNIFQCDLGILVFIDKSQKLIFCTNEVGLHRTAVEQYTIRYAHYIIQLTVFIRHLHFTEI